VSSEKEDFPASNLQQNVGAWESQNDCSYPQELTLQFYIPIQTKNMKIMFHQYKIPRLIEVFVKCCKHEKYKKLGFVQPSDNKQSNYIQKEIKTVLFEFPCTFVKLVFHPNYQNELNLFSQVALASLTFEGELCPSSELTNVSGNILDSFETSSEEEEAEAADPNPNLDMQKK
jgi:hypothetical protein